MWSRSLLGSISWLALLVSVTNAYFLVSVDTLTIQRMDPIVNPGVVSGHVHQVLGGSSFAFNSSTADLRKSTCTSMPIAQDNSNYWFPRLYFQFPQGGKTGASRVLMEAPSYYLYDKGAPGSTKAFTDDFRMISGTPALRSYNASDPAQQAVTFLCLDFQGTPTKYSELPTTSCPSGIRSQINFPSCWDGKNTDSKDHKSHVAFRSGGPDTGSCTDPEFPVTIPRIFSEVYWAAQDFDQHRGEAMNPSQPFVFSNGDPTGYGYHADFMMGWDEGILQNVVDNCNCNDFGDAQCCADQGLFTLRKGAAKCSITKAVDEQVDGLLPNLPGNNPVQPASDARAQTLAETSPPDMLLPVCGYSGDGPPPAGCGTTRTKSAAPAAGLSASSSPVSASSPTSSSSTSQASEPSPSPSPSPSSGTSPSPSPASSTPTSSASETTPMDCETTDANEQGSCSPASPPATTPGTTVKRSLSFERRFQLRRHPMVKRRALSRMDVH